MKQKHFELIASILRKATEYHYNNDVEKTKIAMDMLEVIVYDFDDFLQNTNPKFDSRKFLHACNIEKLTGYNIK